MKDRVGKSESERKRKREKVDTAQREDNGGKRVRTRSGKYLK